MARILLVKSRYTTPDNMSVVPPLGIMYLGSALRESGHDVRLVDVAFPERSFGDVPSALREFVPDVVGISAITFEAESMHALSAGCKRWNPSVPVIVGGPHASSYPDTILKDANVDGLVLGEGERVFLEWVRRRAGGEGLERLKGFAGRVNGRLVKNPPADPIPDVDAIPFPAWDLIDVDAYASRKSMTTVGFRRYMPVFTSRGCPYRCTYCHENFGKSFRGRSPENVLDEMRMLIGKFNIRDFEFLDDIFNWDLLRAKKILKGIAALPVRVKIHFPNGLRCDQLDDEFLTLAAHAGLQFLSVAVETATPRLQRLSKKNLKIERVRRVIDRAVGLGIYTRGFFMLGFPTETLDEMRATVEFAVRSHLHEALFFIVTPFGGTKMGERIASSRDLAGARFSDFDYFRGDYNLSAVSKEELFRLQRTAFRRFYFSFSRIIRIIRAHPQRRHLLKFGWLVLRKILVRKRGNGAVSGFLEEVPPALLEQNA